MISDYVTIHFELTEKCELNCPICFLTRKDRTKTLSFDLLCKLLDECREQKIETVLFSGGDPLLYPMLTEAIEYALQRVSSVEIAISGKGLTKELAKKLYQVSHGRLTVSVSICGSNKELHEKFRDDFDSGIKALDNLSYADIPSVLNFVAFPDAIPDLCNTVKLALCHNVSGIWILSPKRAAKNSFKLRNELNQREIANLCSTIYSLRKKHNEIFIMTEPCFAGMPDYYGCTAGFKQLSVNTDGTFSPCPHFDCAISCDSLASAMQICSGIVRERFLSLDKEQHCLSCLKHGTCCPGVVLTGKCPKYSKKLCFSNGIPGRK